MKKEREREREKEKDCATLILQIHVGSLPYSIMYSVTTPLNKQYALLSKYSIDTENYKCQLFFTFLFCKLLTTCCTIIAIYSPMMDKKSLYLGSVIGTYQYWPGVNSPFLHSIAMQQKITQSDDTVWCSLQLPCKNADLVSGWEATHCSKASALQTRLDWWACKLQTHFTYSALHKIIDTAK